MKKIETRLGLYRVGDKTFDNSYSAMVEGTRTNQKVIFDFNEHIFSAIDWTIPIETPLNVLYAMRAKQLRDEYDYLILNFSGGKDSINILLTFINNGIFLDEIVMNYPFPLESKFNKDDTTNENNFSEIKFAAIPILEKYSSKIDPKTVIRFRDISEPNLKFFARDDWFDILSFNCTPSTRAVHMLYDEKLINLAMKQKNVGNIFGVDKPRMTYHQGNFYSGFHDLPMGLMSHSSLPEYQAMFGEYIHNEPFYWTASLPQLPIKQSQVIAKALDIDTLLRYTIVVQSQLKNSDDIQKTMVLREMLMAKYLYDDKEFVWQTDKITFNLVRKMDDWFWELAPINTKSNYIDAYRQMSKMMDSEYFIGGNILNGKKPLVSGKYLVKRDGV